MSKLLDYLNTLDKDAVAREAHVNDPTTAMTNFGLSAEEQDAVMSGSKEKVADLLGISADMLQAINTIIKTF
jgi:hypothetical protein